MRKSACIAMFVALVSCPLVGGALSPAWVWRTQASLNQSQFGTAIAVVGDLNRDGYNDIVVGSPYYNGGGNGIVNVYRGSAAGLSTTPALTLTGSGAFGRSVAGVGDVNGDGYPDVVVGAPEYGGDLRGAAWLYLGNASGGLSAPLSLPQNNPNAYHQFGTFVSALGDVNGDGHPDFVVNCSAGCDGAAYIYYGGTSAPSQPSLVFNGGQSGTTLLAMRGVGDVNGDGYGDVLARFSSGRVALLLGSPSGLSTTPAWFLDRTAASSPGWLPAFPLGDLNHDGYADLGIFTAGDTTNGGSSTLAIYAGSPSGPTLLQTIQLPYYCNDGLGVGDVDGDGFPDIVLGSVNYSNGESGEGRAFLYRGSAGGIVNQIAWTGEPNSASASYGSPIVGADVNGDGLADVIIGAYNYNNHGAAFAYHGTSAACTAPGAPAGLAVTAPADSQLALTWTAPAGGADHYVIYRSLSDCATAQPKHLNETTATSYLDTTAIPGGHYAYVVTAATAANTCESSTSSCAEGTATGTCTNLPSFAGLATVTPISCGFALSWNAATNNCPGNALRYNVYYSPGTTSFTPFPSNRIASCVSGTTFNALGYGSGAFIVRAANDNGSGSCINEETNTVARYGQSPIDFSDNIETSSASWIASSDVSRDTCRASSGSYSYRMGGGFFCTSYNANANATLVLGGHGNTAGFVFPANLTNLWLKFWQFFSTEAGHDGAWLEYSTTSASGPYTQIPDSVQSGQPYITSGVYTGTVQGQRAWTGTNSSFNQAWVNINALAGHTVWFRWHFVSDASVSSNGYYIDDVSITGNPTALTAVSLAAAGSTTVCLNASSGAVLTATPNGGGPWVYDWGYRTVSGGAITPLSNLHHPTFTIDPAQYPGAGTYYVVASVSGSCGGPVVSNEIPITLANPPQATITASGQTTFCAGGSVTLTATAGMTAYQWSNGATTQSVNVTAGGDYTVTVTDGNGCRSTSPIQRVTVNAPPATITASGPTTFCAGGSVTLSAPAGYTYAWSNGATTQSILVSDAGSFSVAVTDTNGCTATSAATSVTVNPLPQATITAGGPTSFCAGGSVTLTASAGASVRWSNGATMQSISVTASGSFSVTVTDANGCSATSSPVAVAVDTPSAAITVSGPTTFCAGGSVVLTASSGAAYLWSNGATTQSITVGASGAYSVTVTDAGGCSATSAPAAVTVNPLPSPVITASGPTAFCAGGLVTLTSSAAASYAWSTGATTRSIVVTASGTVSVTVTDANGCAATSATTAVTVMAAPRHRSSPRPARRRFARAAPSPSPRRRATHTRGRMARRRNRSR